MLFRSGLDQIGATLGREFSHALIEAVSDAPQGQLAKGLDELVAAEVLFRRGAPPDATYTFKHALLQDTAYESQLNSRRRELHARTANALASKFPARVAAEPQVMARHCAEGGLVAQAIDHYELAAKQAIARLANTEAVDDYTRAVELLATQPDAPERAQREIALRLGMNSPLHAQGAASARVAANYERIEALCEGIAPGPARLPALVGLAVLHTSRADLARAARHARQLLEIADALKIAPLQLAAHAMLGSAATSITNVADACVHFEQMFALAEHTPVPPPVTAFEVDVVAGTSSTYAMNLVLAGKPEQGLARLEAGNARARSLGHAHTLALALGTSVITMHFLEDYTRTIAFSEECLAACKGRGFAQLEANALVFGGWARVMLGDAGGVAQYERGLAQAAGAGVSQIHIAGVEIARRLGKLDEAHAHTQQVEEFIEQSGLHAFRPNVPMLCGELALAAGGDLREAERLLLLSIEGFRGFCSPWMQIRSAIALGEIALRGGDRVAARARIEEIYARIPEGFDTFRMREARRMLSALA